MPRHQRGEKELSQALPLRAPPGCLGGGGEHHSQSPLCPPAWTTTIQSPGCPLVQDTATVLSLPLPSCVLRQVTSPSFGFLIYKMGMYPAPWKWGKNWKWCLYSAQCVVHSQCSTNRSYRYYYFLKILMFPIKSFLIANLCAHTQACQYHHQVYHLRRNQPLPIDPSEDWKALIFSPTKLSIPQPLNFNFSKKLCQRLKKPGQQLFSLTLPLDLSAPKSSALTCRRFIPSVTSHSESCRTLDVLPVVTFQVQCSNALTGNNG